MQCFPDRLSRPSRPSTILLISLLYWSLIAVRPATATNYPNLSDVTGTNASDITGTNASDITGTNASDITGTQSSGANQSRPNLVQNPALVSQAHQLAGELKACAASNCSQLSTLLDRARPLLTQMKQGRVSADRGKGASSQRLW
jgi:hypothetical protein